MVESSPGKGGVRETANSAMVGIGAGGVFVFLFFLEREAYVPLSGVVGLILFLLCLVLAGALSISSSRRRAAVLLLVADLIFFATFFAGSSIINLRDR